MLVLKNGRDVFDRTIDVYIDGTIIQKLVVDSNGGRQGVSEKSEPPCFPDVFEIDLEHKLVIPGLIDLHTHMRDPGLTHKEDFYTGSRSCAKGGITSFFDMPNTVPPTLTQKVLAEKIKSAADKSVVNFGFHFGADKNGNTDEIAAVVSGGLVRSTKVFLNVSTGEMLIQNKELLAEVFKTSPLVFVHAEDEMIDTAIELNAQYGKGLYVCHISSEKEMRTVIKAKQNSRLNNVSHPIYAEVTPHHLFLHEQMRLDSSSEAMFLRMKPELKSKADNAFLLQALRDGFVDTIGTDHAPHTAEEKLKTLTFGIPGTETSLALMLTAVNEGKIELPLIQKLMCENPARIMKLDTKGILKEGFDADIAVADLHTQWYLNEKEMESKCKWSPYGNRSFTGKNYMTAVNGKIVYRDGCFTKEACGCGRFIFGGNK